MKKILQVIAVIAVSAVVSSQAFAQKVVVFSHQDAILGTQIAQQAIEQFQNDAKFLAVKQEAEAMQADLEALKKEYEEQSLVWTEAQKEEKSNQAAQIRQKWQLAVQKIQQMQSELVGGLAQAMEDNLKRAIESVVAAQGADVVLQKQATYYSKPESDITLKVIEALDKLNGKPAASESSAKPQ